MKALLIIDVQDGLIKSKHDTKIINNITKLIKKFRKEEHKIIFVRHLSENEGDLFHIDNESSKIHHSLDYKEEEVINKYTPSAFFNTNLDEELKENKIDELFIAGYNSEYCITFTTISAYDRGYNVHVVEDAIDTVNNGKTYGIDKLDITEFLLTVFYNSNVIDLVETSDII